MAIDYLENLRKNRQSLDSLREKENVDAFFLSHGESVFKIIVASTMVEDAIDTLIVSQLLIINSQKIAEIFIKNKRRPSLISKLDFLRFADIITESDYANLECFFEIRNKYAHALPGTFNGKELLSRLGCLDLSDKSFEKIKSLENNVIKYIAIAGVYSQKKLPEIWRSRESVFNKKHNETPTKS